MGKIIRQFYLLKVEGRFDYAHRLPKHPGKCFSLHGHTAKVIAILEGHYLNEETSMLMDFTILKGILNDVLKRYDHKTILSFDDPLKNGVIAEADVVCLQGQPTAELLAHEIYVSIRNELDYNRSEEEIRAMRLKSVEFFEGEGCSVTYSQIDVT